MTSAYITANDISKLKRSMEERVGLPKATYAALGHVVVGFSWLERTAKKMINIVLFNNVGDAKIITSEMSYKNTIACLSSLVKQRIKDGYCFNCGNENQEEMWSDIVKMLYTCEELRNKLMHSEWMTYKAERLIARKVSGKAKTGLRESANEYSASGLFDIYDYFLCVGCELEQFFFEITQSQPGDLAQPTSPPR